MHLWLPATSKANTLETGADVNNSSLFAGASNLGDEGLMSQSPSQHLSADRGFYKAREGKPNKEIKGGS